MIHLKSTKFGLKISSNITLKKPNQYWNKICYGWFIHLTAYEFLIDYFRLKFDANNYAQLHGFFCLIIVIYLHAVI